MAGLLLAFARQGYLMQNFFDPATLFFVFGVIAVALSFIVPPCPAIRDSRGSRPVIGSPDSRPCPTA